MIVSRGRNFIKLLNNSRILKPSLNNSVSRSHQRWAYRANLQATPFQERVADTIGAVVWGWIIYNFINNYELITGEYFSPDPSLWTDEELGIPPDSAGL